ncbi:LacI family DNA-binding transcriptional regulator [Bifidobacterium platyrrhinorum]|uniref:LacI family DNA-binding transcriptional regulator n=1 Tax=Bifidobacterium platyrrhinorum TaxID=2661628 RepID=A0A6L9SQD3_9BIFI|nr:LacI family DNA-binding transcriptional regulator [Bifidobacterium platyrrhinorum]NEG54395.1 LacI family DNA-binding transcriptional regulator [Bifidobacterium platyrrhinorum]
MKPARETTTTSAPGQTRVSLKDIADELGISQTAVSFAINDRPGVSAETKRRVKQAAAKLGWQPVYAAQALGSSKTMTVGFAPARSAEGLKDETFMLHFMAGVHTSLSHKGYGLLYRPCQSLREECAVYKDWAARKRVDGVILVDLRDGDPRPGMLKDLGVPTVLAGGPDPENLVPSLSIDDSRTMGTILEHLAAQGHRRIAYLSGDPSLDYSRGREAAFRAFARRNALESIRIEFTDFDAERAARLTMEMLDGDLPPTAFIYETELLAASSLHAMAARMLGDGPGDGGGPPRGVYPDDLPAIVSFEDSFVCEVSYPSITSVHRDAGEYGAKVAKLLLKALAGEKVGGNRRILTPRLVVRDSTGRRV